MTDILVDVIQQDVNIPVDIKKVEGTFNYEELNNKPSINGVELDGNKTTADLGISLDTSMYPTREELSEYVKNTDYAGTDKGGVIKQSTTYGFSVNSNTGVPFASTKGLAGYQNSDGNMFIGKNTLENIKDDLVKRGVTTNTIELTDDEKAGAKQWLGYATQSDINTAIASLPQFKISIVEALPETGETKVLYLVPKDGEAPDVYNEYIWIEDTSSFEFLGSTAVDLTDYVKNTDYATLSKAGLIKPTSYFGTNVDSSGAIHSSSYTVEQLNAKSVYTFISKGTLETVLTQYSKTVPIIEADYEALTTKDANTLYLIEE